MPLLLINTIYEGTQGFFSDAEYCCKFKCYDTDTDQIVLLDDKSGHKPYALVKHPIESYHKNLPFEGTELVKKFNRITFTDEWYYKVKFQDPLSIPKISEKYKANEIWENHTSYILGNTADQGIVHGMYYDMNMHPIMPKMDSRMFLDIFEQAENESDEFKAELPKWIYWLMAPVPNMRRAAIDIEVHTVKDMYGFEEVPNPRTGPQPILAWSLWDNEGHSIGVCICDYCMNCDACGKSSEERNLCLAENDGMKALEKEMLLNLFDLLEMYPIILTFNGDGFDLKYLAARARKVGIKKQDIPIYEGTERFVHLHKPVHIDLMQFFQLNPVQKYMFKGKYKETGLDSIGKGLINLGKIHREKSVSELDYAELKAYNIRDSEITCKLTQFDDNLVMQIIILIMRICKMDIMFATRKSGFHWLLHLFVWEHRVKGCLIPNHDEIIAKFPTPETISITKGKQFKGATVLPTKAGVWWNVKSMDYGSMYPTNIKKYNIGYDTINCPHSFCKSNLVPTLHHHYCKEYTSITALQIGLILFLRLKYFKPLSKKDKRYKPIEQALKIIIIMSWGIYAAESFPFSCPVLGECIVSPGRMKIESANKFIGEELHIIVLAGDTDSAFMLNPTIEQCNLVSEWAMQEMETEMAIEDDFRYIVFTNRKKNYLGVLNDGKIQIKGVMAKKSNTPHIYAETFDSLCKVMESVQTPEQFAKMELNVWKAIRKLKSIVQTRDFKLDDIAFHVTLKGYTRKYGTKPAHVQAAILAENVTGRRYDPGSIISFVETHIRGKKHLPTFLAKKEDISVKKYLELLESVFAPLYEPFCKSDYTYSQKVYGTKPLDGFL